MIPHKQTHIFHRLNRISSSGLVLSSCQMQKRRLPPVSAGNHISSAAPAPSAELQQANVRTSLWSEAPPPSSPAEAPGGFHLWSSQLYGDQTAVESGGSNGGLRALQTPLQMQRMKRWKQSTHQAGAAAAFRAWGSLRQEPGTSPSLMLRGALISQCCCVTATASRRPWNT